MDKNPFLTPADIASIHTDIDRAYDTLQAIQDPLPELWFERKVGRDWEPVGSIVPVNIATANRQADGVRDGNEIRPGGECRIREVDFQLVTVQPGDRFKWQEVFCVITLVYQEKWRNRMFEFVYLEDLR